MPVEMILKFPCVAEVVRNEGEKKYTFEAHARPLTVETLYFLLKNFIDTLDRLNLLLVRKKVYRIHTLV